MKLLELNQKEKERFFADVKKECSAFISNTDYPLWRGMSKDKGMGEVHIRTDRKPAGTGKLSNVIFNAYIEKEFKIANIRQKVAFVTPDYRQAADYGFPHAVFPTNHSKLIFSRKVVDSINLLNMIQEKSLSRDLLMVTSGMEFNSREQFVGYYKAFMEDIDISFDYKQFKKYYEDTMKKLEAKYGKFVYYPSFEKFLNPFFEEIRSYDYEITPISQFHLNSSEQFEIGLFGVPYYYVIPESDIEGGHHYYADFKKAKLG